MSNLIRTSNRLPFDFQDGLKVAGVSIELLVERLILESNSRPILNEITIRDALGYVPVSKSGDTMNGSLTINGNLIASGDVTAYSDEKLKTSWGEVCKDFIFKLSKLKSGTFALVSDQTRHAGVSAQSLKEFLPECTPTNENGLLSVAYGNAALVAAVELAKEVVNLRQDLNSSQIKQIEMQESIEELRDQVSNLRTAVNHLTK